MYGPSYMKTLIEWNYAVVSSHAKFKLRMLVVLDITCVCQVKLVSQGQISDMH